MKTLIKSILLRLGYSVRPTPPTGQSDLQRDVFNRFDVPLAAPELTVILVGTTDGLTGMGKVTPALYFSKFSYGLAKRGVACIGYRDCAEAIRNVHRHDPQSTVFVLVYNEVFQREAMKEFATLASLDGFTVYNSPRTGEIIGDKVATNTLLESAGILTPSMVNNTGNKRTFSNARIGSNAAVSIVDAGQSLDPNRYNSLFINTVHDYKGKSYCVALRALTVTGSMLSAYVRLRPTEEHSPSVHASNTPRDPDLIANFHHTLVTSRQQELNDLCEKLGSVLGPGFYAHDILPCRDEGKLYVCETGYKFDDMSYRDWLWPISSDLPFLADHFNLNIADMAAEQIARQAADIRRRQEDR